MRYGTFFGAMEHFSDGTSFGAMEHVINFSVVVCPSHDFSFFSVVVVAFCFCSSSSFVLSVRRTIFPSSAVVAFCFHRYQTVFSVSLGLFLGFDPTFFRFQSDFFPVLT